MGKNSPQHDLSCRSPLAPFQIPGFPLVLLRDPADLTVVKEMLFMAVVVGGEATMSNTRQSQAACAAFSTHTTHFSCLLRHGAIFIVIIPG